MIQYRKTWQNTARIARTTVNVAICRTFLRSVLLWVIDRQGMVTDRSRKYRPLIDSLQMSRFAALSSSIHMPRSMRSVF
jgi:hypothetical protein